MKDQNQHRLIVIIMRKLLNLLKKMKKHQPTKICMFLFLKMTKILVSLHFQNKVIQFAYNYIPQFYYIMLKIK